MYRRKGRSRATATPTIWSALPLLQLAQRLNQRCVELLATVALRRPVEGAVFAHKELWARLDTRSIERAGRCPVLLLSLEFHESGVWKRLVESEERLPLLNAAPPVFTAEEVAPLLRTILAEAWSAARVNTFAASLVFGMAPGVAQALATLKAHRIEEIVYAHATAVRPRWEDSRAFWGRFLEAALSEDEEHSTRVHLHALHLLGGESMLRVG